MEPRDPVRAARGRERLQPGPGGAGGGPPRGGPAETWLRARELRSGAHGARREGRRPGRGAAAGRVLDAGNGRERLPLFSLPRPPAAAVEKSCVWSSALPGSRREWRSPAAAGELRPPVTASVAALGCRAHLCAPGTRGRGRPWSPPRDPVCGVWVTPATDVSCFSALGCIFVGSAVIWGAGWRRWAWSGEDHIWDEPVGWGEGLVETVAGCF